ncbi:MAG: PqqD family protein [Candidatus Omnitrophica bacterium]|nr:PqqD family protein [Candidatus Omnitrophota bacterium]
MDLSRSIIKRNGDIAWRVIEEEALIVDTKGNMIYPLDEVGTRVWELLDGETPAGDIVVRIDEEFEGEKKDLRTDIFKFLEEIINKGLAGICG